MKNISGRISPNMKAAFLAAVVVGVITHATLMITQPVAADPVLFLDWWKHGDWQLYSQGRWSSNLIFFLRGYLVVPVLSCMFTIIECGFCSALVVDVFQIKRRNLAILLGVAVVVHPYFANNQMYYVSNSVFVKCLPVLAVWITYCAKIQFKWKLFINTILILFPVAFVQSSICIFTMLTALKLILDLLMGTKEPLKWKNFALNVCCTILSCGSYLIIWKFLCKLTNTVKFYGGAESYGFMNMLQSLPNSLQKIYRFFVNYFWTNAVVHNTYWYRHILNSFLLFCTCALIALLAKKGIQEGVMEGRAIFLIIGVLFALPIAAMPMALIVTNYTFYLLNATGYVYVIPFVLALIDKSEPRTVTFRVARAVPLIMCVSILWTFALSDNAGYLLLNNRFKQTKELSSRVLTRIEDLEDFSYEMEVCFIGQPSNQAYRINEKLLAASPGGTFNQLGVWPGIWENSDGWGLYIYHYSGVKLNYYSNGKQQRIAELSETNEFKNSGCFPAKDSVQIIDDTVVVKLGEVDYSGYVS